MQKGKSYITIALFCTVQPGIVIVHLKYDAGFIVPDSR